MTHITMLDLQIAHDFSKLAKDPAIYEEMFNAMKNEMLYPPIEEIIPYVLGIIARGI